MILDRIGHFVSDAFYPRSLFFGTHIIRIESSLLTWHFLLVAGIIIVLWVAALISRNRNGWTAICRKSPLVRAFLCTLLALMLIDVVLIGKQPAAKFSEELDRVIRERLGLEILKEHRRTWYTFIQKWLLPFALYNPVVWGALLSVMIGVWRLGREQPFSMTAAAFSLVPLAVMYIAYFNAATIVGAVCKSILSEKDDGFKVSKDVTAGSIYLLAKTCTTNDSTILSLLEVSRKLNRPFSTELGTVDASTNTVNGAPARTVIKFTEDHGCKEFGTVITTFVDEMCTGVNRSLDTYHAVWGVMLVVMSLVVLVSIFSLKRNPDAKRRFF